MKRLTRKQANIIRTQTILEVIILLIMITSFIPVLVMLILSFKTNFEIYHDFFALPDTLAWGNYSKALEQLTRNMINTILVVAFAVILTLVVSALSGYVFAKMKFPGKNFLYLSLIALMMIPSVLYLAPNYTLIQEYGLYNTWWALIFPWVSGGQILGILLCRNSMEAIPTDLFEAAKIEGCNEFKALIKIAIPLAKPILSTIAVMKMVDYYNDFIWPMMVIESNAKQVITVAVKVFTSAMGGTDIGSMFAGYVIATTPLFILFIFTSRLYMEGMTAGAVKG